MRKSAAVMALALPLPRLGAAHARAAACAPADQILAGHYSLHGVMEVGSDLLLKPDGRLESMLAHGALDELASGCWARHGGTLYANKFEASMEDPRKFDRLDLSIASSGKLIRRFDADPTDAYSRRWAAEPVVRK